MSTARLAILPLLLALPSWLASTAQAQSDPGPEAVVLRPVQPRFAGVYRVAAGRLDRTHSIRSTPQMEVIWNNAQLMPYYCPPRTNNEYVDSGILPDRNASSVEQIRAFTITYCSAEPDPNGDAGTISITFYDEYVSCVGPSFSGTSCIYELSGLPMGDANGFVQCWNLEVDLEGVECDTEPGFRTEGTVAREFAWGFRTYDETTGPWLAIGGNGHQGHYTWFDASQASGRPLDATDPFYGCYFGPFGGINSFRMTLFGPELHAWRRRGTVPNGLKVDFEVDALTSTATWSLVEPPTSGVEYWLVAGREPVDVPLAGGTLLVSAVSGSLTSFPAGGSSLTVPMPASLPGGIFTQVVGGPPPVANSLTELSDAWMHN